MSYQYLSWVELKCLDAQHHTQIKYLSMVLVKINQDYRYSAETFKNGGFS